VPVRTYAVVQTLSSGLAYTQVAAVSHTAIPPVNGREFPCPLAHLHPRGSFMRWPWVTCASEEEPSFTNVGGRGVSPPGRLPAAADLLELLQVRGDLTAGLSLADEAAGYTGVPGRDPGPRCRPEPAADRGLAQPWSRSTRCPSPACRFMTWAGRQPALSPSPEEEPGSRPYGSWHWPGKPPASDPQVRLEGSYAGVLGARTTE
jgi:hypothetical protein